ncbi:MAG: N-acetylglucosamine-6-phosphate deacetylase [Candidatus Limnocylindria bacterium]
MTEVLGGRLVLEDAVVAGRVTVEDGLIAAVEVDPDAPSLAGGPYLAPGFVDVHVHGFGGHDAMGGLDALDGMARALLRHGVTSFLPTAVTAPLAALIGFTARVRDWLPGAPADGAEPLGANLEGPFLAEARRGAHDPAHLLDPADVDAADLARLADGLRLITIAPELPGALDRIGWFAAHGVAVSLGHSAATPAEARAGYAAGATGTTHLFNAMTGLDHRSPGLAAAALLDDDAWVELIADGFHVDPALWPLIARLKPVDRLVLVSDAVALAGTGDGLGTLGGLAVEVRGGRVTLAGSDTLAGSVLALDEAVRRLVTAGIGLPAAVAAAGRAPLALIGVTDRGRLAAGQRADIVELDDDLRVRRVMRAGAWQGEAARGPAYPRGREGRAMPNEPKPTVVVERFYAAIDADDVGAMSALCADDVVVRYPADGRLPYGGTWRGREGLLAFLEAHEAAEEILEFSVSSMLAEGDVVIASGVFRGRARDTGRTWATDFVHVLTVAGGRIRRWTSYFDTAAALDAH